MPLCWFWKRPIFSTSQLQTISTKPITSPWLASKQ
jgi:hypothetical protein